jgi:signal transduction histidine kinase
VLAIARESFKTQRLACDRLDDLARTVLNFIRLDSEAWTKGSLHEILENAFALTAHVLRGRIVVEREPGKVSEIDCHPNELSQVFINLIINAAQAIEGAGGIRVRTWEERGMAVVSISDTGVGMTPEVQAHLFEPGFTTKGKHGGTGLGLSLCLKTVQNHGGRIEVQSQPGIGSTFVVSIPVTQPERKGNG